MQQIRTLQHFRIRSVGNVHLFVIGLALNNDYINECARDRTKKN